MDVRPLTSEGEGVLSADGTQHELHGVTHVELSLQHQLMEVRYGETIELRIESDTMIGHRSVFIALAAVFGWYSRVATGLSSAMDLTTRVITMCSRARFHFERFQPCSALHCGYRWHFDVVACGCQRDRLHRFRGREAVAFDAAGNTNC